MDLKDKRLIKHIQQWSLAADVIHTGMEMMPITRSKATEAAYNQLLRSIVKDIEADRVTLGIPLPDRDAD